jgi:hypothetical protein
VPSVKVIIAELGRCTRRAGLKLIPSLYVLSLTMVLPSELSVTWSDDEIALQVTGPPAAPRSSSAELVYGIWTAVALSIRVPAGTAVAAGPGFAVLGRCPIDCGSGGVCCPAVPPPS